MIQRHTIQKFSKISSSLFLIGVFLISCKPDIVKGQNQQEELELISIFNLDIPEPSGLTVSKDEDQLYIVSDDTGNIYQTTLNGAVITEIPLGLKDLEGITFNSELDQFYVVSEKLRKVYTLDLIGNEIGSFKISGKQKEKNSGLEGICYREDNQHLYLVNEKHPKRVLEIDLENNRIESYKISFAKDISGIDFDPNSKTFWIVSDESRKVYQTNEYFEIIQSYSIPVKKAEGIAISKKGLIYIVSDAMETLSVFKLP